MYKYWFDLNSFLPWPLCFLPYFKCTLLFFIPFLLSLCSLFSPASLLLVAGLLLPWFSALRPSCALTNQFRPAFLHRCVWYGKSVLNVILCQDEYWGFFQLAFFKDRGGLVVRRTIVPGWKKYIAYLPSIFTNLSAFLCMRSIKNVFINS